MPADSTATSTGAVVRAAIAAAARAPSSFNAQPWHFTAHPAGSADQHRVDLALDRSRVLAVTDPDAHQARIGCGAALYTLRLSLAVSGHRGDAALLPDPADHDLIATVRLDGKHRATPHERALATAVWRRHTNRRPFLDRPVPPPARTALVRAAAAEGARLHLLERPTDLGAVADLIRRADNLLSQNPAHLTEARRWVGGTGHGDGVPATAAGRPPSPDTLVVLRDLDSPATPVPFERLPLLAVLTTVGDSDGDQIAAGQALQRVLLTACVEGLAVSPLSQPIEVPTTRRALGEVVGAPAHLVLRIGYGHAGVTTPRRPLDEIATGLAEEKRA
ncbi:nitroreductase [Actinokineospora auranticolor]|uniref:Nitroreductase family protein n=1 Tax=Actinokineospora auranticolor TaxID=155976 RepID=A0A2S6GP75_9PSEU|nr:nitroreductase [Actinokineospora auranticolor]PPK67007.1 hypothetical protein CLV40_1083 [Actinokineospora auranticolor]